MSRRNAPGSGPGGTPPAAGRPARRLHLLPLLLLLLLLWSGLPAEARVVGVLFDDSGSMRHNIHLPTFGVQLLIATLDGRTGRDRLVTARLSRFETAFPRRDYQDGSRAQRIPALPIPPGTIGPDNVAQVKAAAAHDLVERYDLDGEAELADIIDTIAGTWPAGRSNTPYEPVEVMLDTLVEETGSGEEAFLVIFSDGAFYDGSQALVPDGLLDSYPAYRRRFEEKGASLRVFFLLTVNAPDPRPLVEAQGVRAALLEVFNGDAGDGSYEVSDFDSLLSAMLAIIAEVSATDPALGSAVVRPAGDAIELDLPFTVTRIISLAVDDARATLPRLEARPFPLARRIDLSPEMEEGDNQEGAIPGWPTTRLRAEVTQLEPSPPLSPGSYRLAYTGPVGERVKLLFRSDVFLDFAIEDSEGRPVEPGAAGGYALSVGRAYRVALRVLERVDGAEREVDLAALPPDAALELTLRTAAGERSFGFERDPARNRATVPLTLTEEGEADLFAALRLPGFLTSRSGTLRVRAEQLDAAVGLVVTPHEPCPDPCPEGTIPLTFRRIAAPEAMADLEVTVDSPREGAFRVRLDPWPEGLLLVTRDGRPLAADGGALPFSPAVPVTLELVRTPAWQPARGSEGLAAAGMAVVLEAVEPLRGGLRRTITIAPRLLPLELRYVGHTDAQGGDGPLTLDLGELDGGRERLRFELVGELLDPPRAGRFEAAPAGPFLAAEPGFEGERGLMAGPYLPTALSWLGCKCWIGLFGTGERTVEARWSGPDGLQQAATPAPLRIEARWWQTVLACLWPLFLIWLVGVACALALERRFPRMSRLHVEEHGLTLPRLERLRGTFAEDLRRCLWRPFCRPAERRRVEGLTLVASAAGARIEPRKGWPPFLLTRYGQPLEEIAAAARLRTGIELLWGDMLEALDGTDRRLTLLKDYREKG